MRNRSTTVLGVIFSGSIFFICCSPILLKPVEQDVSHAKTRWPEVTAADLQSGYNIFVNKCGGCHLLYTPEKYSEERWLKIIPDMAKKAKITEEQESLLTKYILTKRATIPVK